MNVLSLTSSYPRFEGDPTAPFIGSIVQHIAGLGHTVHLVLPEHKDWAHPSSEGGVHYHTYRYSPVRSWTPWGYSQSLEGGVKLRRSLLALAPIVYVSASRTCRRLTASERFDVVHAHWLVPNGLLAAGVSRQRRLPLVVSLHGSDVSVVERSPWLRHAARRVFTRASAVTAPSGDLLERARALGATCDLVRIPYGVDTGTVPEATASRARARLGLDAHDALVAGVGRLIPVKGFEYLIEGFARAAVTNPALRLVIVGDGPERGRLEALATRSGVRERVTFAGLASPEQVPVYLAAADMVVVPSVRHRGFVDGLPNVALEAMASGRALVATRVGGLPELVRAGETGLLVDEQDAAGLADAILSLAHDPELRARLGRAAQLEMREHRSWAAAAGRFLDVYERVARTG